MTADGVVVVGGGVAGLTAALELAESGLPVTLVESSRRFGGKIATSRVGGLVIEAGAESFLAAKPAGLALCERLGIGHRLIDSNRHDRRTFVWSKGRLRELPDGLVLGSPARAWGLLRSGLLSPVGAARLVADVAVPRRRADGEETVGGFFTRRVGREAYTRIVEPLLAGIHAGDADTLSLAATFPRFLEMERLHGGLVRATLSGARSRCGGPLGPVPARHTPFVSFHGGMGELIDALVARLAARGVTLLSGREVRSLTALDGGYEVRLDGGQRLAPVPAVVLASPAPVTARLLRDVCPAAAEDLAGIVHASTATVSLAYRRSDAGRPPAGYGFVVPRAEGRRLLAATFASSKWSGRAPADQVLVRGYVGGVGREAILDADDDGLVGLVRGELFALAGIRGEPVHTEVHRYPSGMPQYTVGHLDRVARIRSALGAWPGLAVTGAAYGGPGVPDCIADALSTAQMVLAGRRVAAARR